MLGNRRNLIFRVSIVINIAVLLYAAMHFSGNAPNGIEWMPISEDGRNESDTRVFYSSARTYDETSLLNKTSAFTTTKKSVSSTTAILELDSKNRDRREPTTPTETTPDAKGNDTIISEATSRQLQSLLRCNKKEYIFQALQRGEFWVLKNYVTADHGPIDCHTSITYTTHSGFEYLDNVLPLVTRWMGPVSLAIHAPGTDFTPTVNSIRYLRDCTKSNLIRRFVTFHVFFSYRHIPSKIPDAKSFLSTPYNCSMKAPYIVNSSSTYMKQNQLLYPVNVARNIAREAALTHYVLPSDIELYPSPKLIPRFLNMIARNQKPLNTSRNPRIFPISIFEVTAQVKVPLTKKELQAMLAKKTAIPFHKYVCPNCHTLPQSKQWINAPETKQLDVFHVGKRRGIYAHWEPIFIGTNSDPYYDERLSWDGKMDKMPQGYVLCVMDYDFMILNNAFLTHKPGIKRYFKDAKRDSIAGKQRSFIKTRILPELNRIYGTRSGCLM